MNFARCCGKTTKGQRCATYESGRHAVVGHVYYGGWFIVNPGAPLGDYFSFNGLPVGYQCETSAQPPVSSPPSDPVFQPGELGALGEKECRRPNVKSAFQGITKTHRLFAVLVGASSIRPRSFRALI